MQFSQLYNLSKDFIYLGDGLISVFFVLQVLFLRKMSLSSIKDKHGHHTKEPSWKSHLGSGKKKKVQNVLLDIEVSFIGSIN